MKKKKLGKLINEYLSNLSDDNTDEYYISDRKLAKQELTSFVTWLIDNGKLKRKPKFKPGQIVVWTGKDKFKPGQIVVWTGEDPAIGRIKSRCPAHENSWNLTERTTGRYTSCDEALLRHATKKEREIFRHQIVTLT